MTIGVLGLATGGGLMLGSGGDDPAVEGAHPHAEAACDLIARAEETGRVDTGARNAAAILLLDNAIIESERAADADDRFSRLDDAVKAVHTAAHAGRADPYNDAMTAAMSQCRDIVD